MPVGQSRSGYGLNFSGFILMIFFLVKFILQSNYLIKYRAPNYYYTPAWYKMTLHRCSYDVPESLEAPYTFDNYPSTV